MSLEAKIDTLTAAVETLTKALEGGLSAKTTASAAPSKDKEVSEDKPRTTRGRAAKKAISTSDLKKAAESFLDNNDGDDDYADRRAHIKKIIAKFDSPKFTEIAEADRQAALDMLKEFESGEGASSKEDDDDI